MARAKQSAKRTPTGPRSWTTSQKQGKVRSAKKTKGQDQKNAADRAINGMWY
jgi:hypothetical protein